MDAGFAVRFIRILRSSFLTASFRRRRAPRHRRYPENGTTASASGPSETWAASSSPSTARTTALSRRYQVSEQTLYRWRDEFLAGGRARLSKSSGADKAAEKRIAKLKEELDRRAQVIGELSLANDFLKEFRES